MDKYMKKSDVIAYICEEAKEAQSAFEECGGESGIIAEAFEDLADDIARSVTSYTTVAEAFTQIPATPAVSAPQWISVDDALPAVKDPVLWLLQDGQVFRGELRNCGGLPELWYYYDAACDDMDLLGYVYKTMDGLWFHDNAVVAWMPFIAPVKGDADNG